MQRKVAMRAEKGAEKVTMSAEKGGHELGYMI